MKKLKFHNDDPQQKQFLTTVRKRVNNYFRENGISKKGDIGLHVKAVIILTIYAAPFVLILALPINAWLALLLVIIMGIGEAGIGMSVMHDGAHGSFSKKRIINSLCAGTMYLLGSNTLNWKIQHNILHQTYTNIYGYDPDIESKAIIRLSDHASIKRKHRFQYLYAFFLYGLMTLSKLITDFKQLMDFKRAGLLSEQQIKPGKEIFKLIVSKIIYVTILIGLPLWLTNFYWWQVILGFALMHITAGMIMSTIFQMAHVVEGAAQPLPDEDGIIDTEWAVHQLRSTSDFARNNLFLNWYVGGLNFQIEHHLFPNISHVHYRNIAPIVEKTAHELGLVYNLKPSFSNALGSHKLRLKALGDK